MNNNFYSNAAIAGQPGQASQGFGVLGFSHLGHGMADTSMASPGSLLTSTSGSGNSMALGPGALTTGNITAMHPPGQVTAMPPPSSANSQHLAQQMHAQASHPQYLYQQQQQQQQRQLLMNAATANGAWFLSNGNGVPPGMISPMVGQIGTPAFGQDRSLTAAQQQQGTQALLSHLVSLTPPQPSFSAANMASGLQPQQQQQQQQQRQYPGSLFMEQQMNQIFQRQQPALQGIQHEQDNSSANIASALSLDHSQAMPPPPPPPKSAPAPLGQPSAPSSSAQSGQMFGPHPLPSTAQAGQKPGQQSLLLTPQLARKEANPPPASRSTSSTTTSTPPLASTILAPTAQQAFAAGAEAALKLTRSSVEPDRLTPAADIATIPRPESTISTSPALSTATKMSKTSPKLAKKGSSKETKRKSGALTFKKDAVSSSATVGTVLVVKQKAGQPASLKKSRTTPAQIPLHPQPAPPPPAVPAMDTAPATPLVSSMTLPLSATTLSQIPVIPLITKKLSRVASAASLQTTVANQPALPRIPSQSASHTQLGSLGLPALDLPPAPLQTLQAAAHLVPAILSQKEVLGRGIEQLLKFHSIFAPASDVRDLDYWKTAISDNFCDIGNIRLELGTQSYDMPVAAAGGFYYRLFSEGTVVSMYMALGQPKIYRLKQNASIMSFHGVHLTTAYANGRRVLEAGDLRVIFDEDFRIRLWAFSSEDATVCLPRKRPNGTDDALTRTCEATIGRNLDWPNALPTPKRRKSANGKQPPEECALPACALQHLEIANTMYYLQELVALQLQNKTSSEGIMDIWLKAAKPEPLATKQPVKVPGPERKRSRKKSTAAALPLPLPLPLPPAPAPTLARADDTIELGAGDSKAKRPAVTASPGVVVASKPSRQQAKH
ncbi:hypothetical protein GGI13_003958 [Coemansia sp. RSA 455]|nr:hypothetical protein GGI13_003958 [Coemansia sp. RSA 455]